MAKVTNLPQKVVYLIGAGATQAEADYEGGKSINILMRDNDKGHGVCTRIIDKITKQQDQELIPYIQGKRNVDVEQLISLLLSTGIEKDTAVASRLKRMYFEDIVRCLQEKELLDKPKLTMALMELYRNKAFEAKEKLHGIITTNHDNLLQNASRKVIGGVNLGFEINEQAHTDNNKFPYILHLHGAFNWQSVLPTTVIELNSDCYNNNCLWIPPGITKESKIYPYNQLMGLAYEILYECDILRIVGCSLTQNDWNIIALVFNTQYFQYNSRGSCYSIELIMGHTNGLELKNNYAYIEKLTPIGELEGGFCVAYKKYYNNNKDINGTDLENVFKYWLKAKTRYHIEKEEIDKNNLGQYLKELLER